MCVCEFHHGSIALVRANATTINVNLVEPNTLFLDYQNQLDGRVGKTFRFGRFQAQGFVDIFNVMNAGRYTEWHRSGANLSYNPTFYLVQDNQQTSRAYQVDITYRF